MSSFNESGNSSRRSFQGIISKLSFFKSKSIVISWIFVTQRSFRDSMISLTILRFGSCFHGNFELVRNSIWFHESLQFILNLWFHDFPPIFQRIISNQFWSKETLQGTRATTHPNWETNQDHQQEVQPPIRTTTKSSSVDHLASPHH